MTVRSPSVLSKDKLREKLRELGAVPPADATADELVAMLRRVKAIKEQKVVQPPAPAPRPTFTPAPVTTSPGAVLAQERITTRSDHHRRPYDPLAGW